MQTNWLSHATLGYKTYSKKTYLVSHGWKVKVALFFTYLSVCKAWEKCRFMDITQSPNPRQGTGRLSTLTL